MLPRAPPIATHRYVMTLGADIEPEIANHQSFLILGRSKKAHPYPR